MTFETPSNNVKTFTEGAKECGTVEYSIHSDASGAYFSYDPAWAVISGTNPYTLTIDTSQDLNLISNSEVSKTIPIYIKAKFDSEYNAKQTVSYTQIDIVIEQSLSCDCSYLAWDDPSSGVTVAEPILAGTSTSTQTLAPAVPNTSSVNPSYRLCYDATEPPGCVDTGAFTSL